MATFLPGEIANRSGQARVGDPVIGEGFHRLEAALDLVLSLGPGIEALQAVGDAELDTLVIAGLEVEAVELLPAAPVATIECVARAEIERA